LSSLIPLEPRAWRFVLGPDGRPDIDPQTPGLPPEGRALSCNLAHTRGLVAVAVSTVPATGVDAEFRGRRTDLARLARAKFAPAEVQRLGREVEGEAFRRRFFRYWTLKESYLKARGTGLRLPLDGFAFDVEPDRPIAVSIAEELEDDGAAWQFAVADVDPQHSLALALRRGIGQPDLGVRWLGPGV
jgi:4'-phosphopantetheinyl transferase